MTACLGKKKVHKRHQCNRYLSPSFNDNELRRKSITRYFIIQEQSLTKRGNVSFFIRPIKDSQLLPPLILLIKPLCMRLVLIINCWRKDEH